MNQRNIFQRFSRRPTLVKPENIFDESSQSDEEISKSTKIYVRKRSKSCPSVENLYSLWYNTQLSSDQTKDTSELNAYLSKRFETSLNVSNKPETNSTEEDLRENNNIPQESVLLERQSSLQENLLKLYESSPSSCNVLRRIKVADKISSLSSEKTVNLKQDAENKQTPLCNSGNGARYSSRFLNIQYPKRSHSNGNSTQLHRSLNAVPIESYANTEQNLEQSLLHPNFIDISKTDQNFYQVQASLPALKENNTFKCQFNIHSPRQNIQQPHIEKPELPVFLPQYMRPYYPLLPIRTNAVPMRYGQYQTYYRNPMSPINTNAVRMQFVRPASPNRNQKSPINREGMQYVRPDTPNRNKKSPINREGMQYVIPDTPNRNKKSPINQGGMRYVRPASPNRNQKYPINREGMQYVRPASPNRNKKSPINQGGIRYVRPDSPNCNQKSPINRGGMQCVRPTSPNRNKKSAINQGGMRYVRPASPNSNQKSPINRGGMQCVRPASPNRNQKSPINREGSHFTSDVIQNALTEAAVLAGSISKSSTRKTRKSKVKKTVDPNAIDSNFTQSKKIIEEKEELTKTDKTDLTTKDLAKTDGFTKTESPKMENRNIKQKKVQPTDTTTCKNKDILKVDVSNKLSTASLFPLCSNIQGRTGSLPFQQDPTQFPAPLSMNYSVITSPVKRGINLHRPYQDMGTGGHLILSDPACTNPLITEQPIPSLTKPDSTLTQAGINAANPIEDPIQATKKKSDEIRYQHSMQNPTVYPQYQYLNSPAHRMRTQYPPFFPLLPSLQTYENINTIMNPQIATQYSNGPQLLPIIQNATTTPNYQDSNFPVYPFQPLMPYPNIHSIQYQQVVTNIIEAAQYANPYHATSRHEIANPSFSIARQQIFSSNIPGRQIYQENLSSINMSHYPSWPCVTSGITSQIFTNEPYLTSYPIYGYVPFNIPEMGPFKYSAWSTNDDSDTLD